MLPSVTGPRSRWAPLLAFVVAWFLAWTVLSAPTGAQASAQAPVAADPALDLPNPPTKCLDSGGAVSFDVRPCWLTKYRKNRPTVVLWGDSHAIQLVPAVRKAARGRKVNVAMFAVGSCPPMKYRPGAYNPRSQGCADFNADALRFVARLHRGKREVRVILAGYWHGWQRLHRRWYVSKTEDFSDRPAWQKNVVRAFPTRMPALTRTLGSMGVHTDLVGHTATVPPDRPACAAGEAPYVCDIARSAALPEEGQLRRWLKRQARSFPRDSRLIDVNGAFCTASVCRGLQQGIYTFYNDLHLSKTRSKTLARYVAPSITRLRRQ